MYILRNAVLAVILLAISSSLFAKPVHPRRVEPAPAPSPAQPAPAPEPEPAATQETQTGKETQGWSLSWPESRNIDVTTDNSGNVIVTGFCIGTTDFDPCEEKTCEYIPSVATVEYLSKFSPDGEFQWARTWAATPSSVTTDGVGDIYVVGKFSGTVNFDPISNLHFRTSNGGEDAFLCKYDPDGNFKWVRAWGGPGADLALSVVVDGIGQIYMVGNFDGTVDFNPVGEKAEKTSTGMQDFFIVKYAPGGEFQWAFTSGGTDVDACTAVALDGIGDVLLTGWFSVPTDVSSPFSESTNSDAFLCKVDSGGNEVWYRSWGGNYEEMATGIALGSAGNIYVTGGFRGNNVDFDPGGEVFPMSSDTEIRSFISKFTPDGDFQWTNQLRAQIFDLAVNAASNIVIAGNFNGTVEFDPGEGVCELTGGGGYVANFTPDGLLNWAIPCLCSTFGAAVDELGYIYVCGESKAKATLMKITPDGKM